MPNANDRRVRKTRAQLRQALEQLLQEKPLHSITVKELCEVSDINRGTFYLHYADVPALLAAIEQEMLDDFEAVLERVTQEKARSPGGYDIPTIEFIRFLAANQNMCRALLCSQIDKPLLERLTEIVRTQFMQAWQWPASNDVRDPSAYAFTFMVEGSIGMLRRWLEDGMPVSQEDMALLLRAIPARGIAALEEMGREQQLLNQ